MLNDAEASEYIWSVPNFYSTNTLIKVLGNGLGGVVGSEIVGPLAVIPGSLDDLLSDGWNLISLPLDPLDGSTFADVFLTALPSPHYIYNLSESGQYGIVDDSMSVTTASGYWIALFENASITLEAENQILTESILLHSGWNLIGCPQPFDVDTSSLMIVSGTDTMSFNDAVAGGFLSSSAIYNWDSQTTSYVSNDALKTWNGQWIASNVDNIELLVPPIFADTTTSAARQMIVPTPDNWEIIIEVETDDLADRITKLGVLESATDGFDPQFDYPEPPSPPGGQFIEAYFPHDDWSTILGSKYNFDIRAPLEEGEDATWYIEINGSGTRPITLIWGDMSSLLPPDYSAWLYIPSLFSAVNMFDVTSEEITLELPDNIYIIISTQYLSLSDILGLPTEFALHHNYPNPFKDRKSTRLNSSHVVISYAVFCLKKKNIRLSRT